MLMPEILKNNSFYRIVPQQSGVSADDVALNPSRYKGYMPNKMGNVYFKNKNTLELKLPGYLSLGVLLIAGLNFLLK